MVTTLCRNRRSQCQAKAASKEEGQSEAASWCWCDWSLCQDCWWDQIGNLFPIWIHSEVTPIILLWIDIRHNHCVQLEVPCWRKSSHRWPTWLWNFPRRTICERPCRTTRSVLKSTWMSFLDCSSLFVVATSALKLAESIGCGFLIDALKDQVVEHSGQLHRHEGWSWGRGWVWNPCNSVHYRQSKKTSFMSLQVIGLSFGGEEASAGESPSPCRPLWVQEAVSSIILKLLRCWMECRLWLGWPDRRPEGVLFQQTPNQLSI